VKHLPEYDASQVDAAQLLAQQRIVRLVTVDPAGWPRVGLHVFVHDELSVEMHLANDDPQLDDMRRTSLAVVEVDRLLAFSPSYWVDPESATHGNQYYQFAAFRGEPELAGSPEDVAAHLRALLARYQPEGGYEPIADDSSLYRSYYDQLTVVRLRPIEVLTKFKLLQLASPSVRTRVVDGLLERGGEVDRATMSAIVKTIRPPGSPGA
jgi:hypothetical protein